MSPTPRTASEFDTDLTVRRVVPVTHDVTTFVFDAPPGWVGRHEPGQHLVVTATVNGAPVERCYTISSPPTRPSTLTITVKRHPDGVLSPWLHENLRPGDRLRARGPVGAFTTSDHPAPKYLFLSAGSGITPLMSMTRALADTGSDADVVFVHSARTPADIIFRRELEALHESGLAVRVHSICETDLPADRWSGPLGRLSLELLRWIAPDAADREVFLCGPPGYMDATTALLDQIGVDPDRVHRESFTIGDAAALFADDDPSAASALPPQGAQIELRKSGRVVHCPADVPVLQALEDAGVLLRSSCREGLCGTCKSTLLEGEVDMRHQGGIRPREVAMGFFLPCCSRPLTDLVLDL